MNLLPKNSETSSPFRIIPLWFIAGTSAGVGAWMWGSSEWPARLFTFSFGVSIFVLALVLLLTLLFLLGRLTWHRAHHARNDFANFGPWALGRLQRGVSALVGMALIALLAFVSVGSQNGAKVTLLCGLFAAGLQWCTYCMHVMLSAQTSASERSGT